MMAANDLKKFACEAIDLNATILNGLSKKLWENPEIAYEEYQAHDLLTDFLESSGFSVVRRFHLPTAFKATYNQDGRGPNVSVLCEYDALPGIGHACGHNLIAELGVAAALGIKAALEKCKEPPGKLTVIGTPAEEGKCGKEDLVRAQAFQDIDVAMMAHPSQFTTSRPKFVSMISINIKYYGKAAHASSWPWDGVNALDAAVLCYNNISCMRQQLKPNWRVHGVIRHGGTEPNVIPDNTELSFFLRTPYESELNVLKEKVLNCINGAAVSTGCTVEYVFADKHYKCLHTNETMAKLFDANAKDIGVKLDTDPEILQKFGGSTDMGNVSHVIPSLHPKFFIGTSVSNHSKEFTVAAGSSEAQPYSLNIAKALAMTALDIYTQPGVMGKIKDDFRSVQT